jgi:hypothetical protein
MEPKNRTCGAAIPVQRSNQLRYRGQLSSSNHKFMHIYSNVTARRTFGTRCQFQQIFPNNFPNNFVQTTLEWFENGAEKSQLAVAFTS